MKQPLASETGSQVKPWFRVEMYKSLFTTLALFAFGIALLLTGLGGWADMMGKPLVFSKQHAWNDGIVVMLIAIFFLLLSRA